MPHNDKNPTMKFYLHRFIASIVFQGVVAAAAFSQGQEADYLGESARSK